MLLVALRVLVTSGSQLALQSCQPVNPMDMLEYIPALTSLRVQAPRAPRLRPIQLPHTDGQLACWLKLMLCHVIHDMHTYIHTYIHTWYIPSYMHMHMHMRMNMHMQMHMHIHGHIHRHTYYTYTDTDTDTHAHKHAHTNLCVCATPVPKDVGCSS